MDALLDLADRSCTKRSSLHRSGCLFNAQDIARTIACQPVMRNRSYLAVLVVVSVVFSDVLPPAPGVAGAVVVFVSVVVVVSSVVLPSLVCEVVVSVLFSVVPFRLSQPIDTTPSVATTTNAKKHLISVPFLVIRGLPVNRHHPYGFQKRATGQRLPPWHWSDVRSWQKLPGTRTSPVARHFPVG